MLKEKRNQGMIGLAILSGIFLLIAGIMGFILFSKSNSSTAYDRNKAPGSDATVYAEVSDIYPEALIEVDDNTEVWLVQYKDGFVGLQAKKGDKQISQLLEKAESGDLAKNPVKIVGSYINTSVQNKDKSYISNYGSLIRDLTVDSPEIAASLSTTSYISISEFQSEQLQFTFYTLFCLGFVIFFIVFGLIGRKKNIQAYDAIYAAYPEVKDNLNILLEQAAFHDDVLKIAIYKNHLITYYRGFKAVDLTETVQLYHHIFTMHRGFASNRNSSLVAIRPNQKKYQMPIKNIGKTTDSKLQSAFDYLYNNFPHIKLGI